MKGHRRSLSSNNLLAPSSNKKTLPPDAIQAQDYTGIANDTDNTDGGYNISNGSPTIHHDVPIGRSSSDGKDYVTSSMRNQDSYPVKKKYTNRNKSCELDSNSQEMTVDPCSDVDGIFFVPTTPITKKKVHRRQKSNAVNKELGLEGRATDNGKLIFTCFHFARYLKKIEDVRRWEKIFR